MGSGRQLVTHHYNSFLLRCWQVEQDELRIKIEHIQSGEQTQVVTAAEALAWLSEHWSQGHQNSGISRGQPMSTEDQVAARRKNN